MTDRPTDGPPTNPPPPQQQTPTIPPLTMIAGCLSGALLWVFAFHALRWLCLTVDALITRIAQ